MSVVPAVQRLFEGYSYDVSPTGWKGNPEGVGQDGRPCAHCLTHLHQDLEIICVCSENPLRCALCKVDKVKCNGIPDCVLGAAQTYWNWAKGILWREYAALQGRMTAIRSHQRYRVVNYIMIQSGYWRRLFEWIADPAGLSGLSAAAQNTRLMQIQLQEAAAVREWQQQEFELNVSSPPFLRFAFANLLRTRRQNGNPATPSSVARHRQATRPMYLQDMTRATACLEHLAKADNCHEIIVQGESGRSSFPRLDAEHKDAIAAAISLGRNAPACAPAYLGQGTIPRPGAYNEIGGSQGSTAPQSTRQSSGNAEPLQPDESLHDPFEDYQDFTGMTD